jgi:hypothetical protein
MTRNRQKLFRLTKLGHQLVNEALKGYDSILQFCEAHKDQHLRRQTFTKFHDGEGVERTTAEDCCIVLKIPNWQEDWDRIIEIVPDKITDWNAYDNNSWVGRKQIINDLTKSYVDRIDYYCYWGLRELVRQLCLNVLLMAFKVDLPKY